LKKKVDMVDKEKARKRQKEWQRNNRDGVRKSQKKYYHTHKAERKENHDKWVATRRGSYRAPFGKKCVWPTRTLESSGNHT
jgi:hypothetical protein